MARYSSKPKLVEGKSPAEISERFSDLTRLQPVIDALPEAERSRLGDIKSTPDSVSVLVPQIGDIKFLVKERTDNRVVFIAEGSPLPLSIIVDLESAGQSGTNLVTNLEIEIPAMLKMMLGGTLNKAVDKFSELMVKISGC